MKKTNKKINWIYPFILIGVLFMLQSSCKKDSNTTSTLIPTPTTITDIDGNVYHSVTIGTQTWMVENLKTTHYRNGDAIPYITDGNTWSTLTTGAYCSYNNDVNNVATYGRLYNWFVITDSRNIAPTGWHVPSDAEWTTLSTYLGGDSYAGGKMKALNVWGATDGGTNSSGFTALPGGIRNYDGAFWYFGIYCGWWSTTLYDSGSSYCSFLTQGSNTRNRFNFDFNYGVSIRCVKD